MIEDVNTKGEQTITERKSIKERKSKRDMKSKRVIHNIQPL